MRDKNKRRNMKIFINLYIMAPNDYHNDSVPQCMQNMGIEHY